MQKFSVAWIIFLLQILTPAFGIDIDEALRKKLISLEVKAKGMTEDNISSYYSNCLEGSFHNLSDSAISIDFETGWIMIPSKDNVQHLMIVSDLIVKLKPKEKIRKDLFAMCIEKTKAAPDQGLIYTLGTTAGKKLQDMAKLISANKWHDYTGQSAVWSLLDDSPLTYISGEDSSKVNQLRRLVARESGKTFVEAGRETSIANNTSAVQTIKKYRMSIDGEFNYTLAEAVPGGSISVYDEEGIERAAYYKDHDFIKGEHSFTFTFKTVTTNPGAIFFLRLKDKNGRVVKERRVN